MALPNIFTKETSDLMIARINQLTPSSTPKWGKMDVAQMLAHCNVTYEMVYTDKHQKPGGFVKLLLKWMVKGKVVGESPYPQNGRTAPQFLIADARNFENEKSRLIDFIQKTQQLGAAHFDNKESHSFGNLTWIEWNNMFYKHLNHHLTQFGV